MARFEMSISDGERILVDYPAEGMQALMSELTSQDFLLFTEVKLGATTAAREVIVATRQITMIRPADSESRQSSVFRPKR